MDLLGLGLPELGLIVIIGGIIAFHILMLVHVWQRPHSLLVRLLLSAAIIFIPFAGALFYWWQMEVRPTRQKPKPPRVLQ